MDLRVYYINLYIRSLDTDSAMMKPERPILIQAYACVSANPDDAAKRAIEREPRLEDNRWQLELVTCVNPQGAYIFEPVYLCVALEREAEVVTRTIARLEDGDPDGIPGPVIIRHFDL